jgi:hypothetical protein
MRRLLSAICCALLLAFVTGCAGGGPKLAPITGVPAKMDDHDGHVHSAYCGQSRRLYDGHWVYRYKGGWEYYDSGKWYRYR